MNGNMALGARVERLEKGGGSSQNKGHEYSTEETIVGKWIDGKTLYEKTFINAISDSREYSLVANTSDLNIDNICHSNAVWKSSDGYSYEGNNDDGQKYYIYRCGKENIQFSTVGINASEIKVTIQYTKTE